MSYKKCILLLMTIMILFYVTKSSQCTVTETVTFDSCILYCWDTYQGKKDFYDFSSGNCLQRVLCGPGYYNDYQNNICIDEFGGYILRDLGYVIKTKEQIVRFAKLQVLKGYTVGNKLICDDGWKSSMRTQKKNDISLIIYLCDEELKDGQIYPKTHGEYFFEKLTLEQQVYVMDTVLGIDKLSNFFNFKNNLFLAFTIVYLFLNFINCCISLKKKAKSCFKCYKKENIDSSNLNETEKKEVQQFLQKRKEQKLKALGDIKYFSLQDQFYQQLQIIKSIRSQSEQFSMQKRLLKLKSKSIEINQKQQEKDLYIKGRQQQQENKEQHQNIKKKIFN